MHWALGTGHWALGIGHWALGIGRWACACAFAARIPARRADFKHYVPWWPGVARHDLKQVANTDGIAVQPAHEHVLPETRRVLCLQEAAPAPVKVPLELFVVFCGLPGQNWRNTMSSGLPEPDSVLGCGCTPSRIRNALATHRHRHRQCVVRKLQRTWASTARSRMSACKPAFFASLFQSVEWRKPDLLTLAQSVGDLGLHLDPGTPAPAPARCSVNK